MLIRLHQIEPVGGAREGRRLVNKGAPHPCPYALQSPPQGWSGVQVGGPAGAAAGCPCSSYAVRLCLMRSGMN